MQIGGIYYDEESNEYAISFGKTLHFLFDDITDIDEMVEIGGEQNVIHKPELHLSLDKVKKEWRIKSDGSSKDTIVIKGTYTETFENSMKPYLKIFMK